MIFFSIGLPGRFADWCDGVLVRLAAALGGTVATNIWPSVAEMLTIWPAAPALDQIALTMIGEAPTHLVMGARQPDERLWTALAETDARFVIALDDPRLAGADMIAETGAELGMAVRAVANCCPLIMRFAALPGALTLHGDRARADIGGALFAIARHLAPSVSEDRTAQIVDGIAAADLSRAFVARGQFSRAITDGEQRVIDGALSGYAEQFVGRGGFGQVIWRRELFVLGVEGLDRPAGVIEVAGPPRTLVHGPYIHLPPGRWTARVVLGVSSEAVGNTFFLDAFADTKQLGYAVLVAAKPGVYATAIDFAVEQLSPLGLEIRVFVTNENARGRLAFGHVVLQPLSTRQPDAVGGSEDFESVLDL